MVLETYLSDYVYKIVVEYSLQTTEITDDLVTPQLVYDWEKINETLGGVPDELSVVEQDVRWHEAGARLVWRGFHSAAQAVSAAGPSERKALCQQARWVCGQHDEALYFSNDDTDTLLATLHLTAAFERALGNVYLTKNHPVPFLLRDLLMTPEITRVFGKVPTMFSQLVMGYPQALNLRNVAWHGFVSPGELHPHLVPGLVVLIASLGQLLPPDLGIQKRPLFSFEKFDGELSSVFVTESCEQVQSIIHSSPQISKKTHIYWLKAFELFQNKRYGDCLVLLLPQLEHCLRVIYCRVNDCPARQCTAESSVHYTTLDQILAPSSRLVVGEGLLSSLLDLNSCLSGPRLRDRLSHGEADLATLPRSLAHHALCVALTVAHQNSEEACGCSIGLCSSLQEAGTQYRSQYHVVARLRRQVETAMDQLEKLMLSPPQPPAMPNPLACPHVSALDLQLFPRAASAAERALMVRECLQYDAPTLFRPRAELELGGGLLSVAVDVGGTADKLRHAVERRHTQHCERTLRSRGRATYQRLLATAPDLCTALLCLLRLIALCYKHLPTLADDESYKRLVRRMLKAVQNSVVLCDMDRGRWTEAHGLLSSLSHTTHQWLLQNSFVLPSK